MKTVCVPKNSRAQIDLDFDQVRQDELIEIKVGNALDTLVIY